MLTLFASYVGTMDVENLDGEHMIKVTYFVGIGVGYDFYSTVNLYRMKTVINKYKHETSVLVNLLFLNDF